MSINRMIRKTCACLLAAALVVTGPAFAGDGNSYAANKVTGFPSSYAKILKKLQKQHPNWKFVAVNTKLNWSQAYNKMCSNPGANTVWYQFGYSYRSTAKGCYNYLTRTYTPKDGTRFYAASPQAVAYYMDPRNWLSEKYIFMFEDQAYHSEYQTLAAVRSVFRGRNAKLYKYSKVFITAAKKYNISAIYLASKALEEQGSGINCGKVGGKKVYNIFNIGAYDSASGGAKNGLKYARYGITYQRPWTTITKAIMGGAQYLAKNYSSKNQNSHYLEHFNVLNGLSKVGTHVYMTAAYAPGNNAVVTYNNYKKYGITNKKIVFRIPVFKNMPSTPCKAPSSSMHKCNNYYLKTLYFKVGDSKIKMIKKTKLNYNTTFKRYVNRLTTSVTITARARDKKAVVTGAGFKKLKVGWNTFKIKVKATSGKTRTYTVKIKRT